jgi:drug/metabolite transporter (DMT)-like permease
MDGTVIIKAILLISVVSAVISYAVTKYLSPDLTEVKLHRKLAWAICILGSVVFYAFVGFDFTAGDLANLIVMILASMVGTVLAYYLLIKKEPSLQDVQQYIKNRNAKG